METLRFENVLQEEIVKMIHGRFFSSLFPELRACDFKRGDRRRTSRIKKTWAKLTILRILPEVRLGILARYFAPQFVQRLRSQK